MKTSLTTILVLGTLSGAAAQTAGKEAPQSRPTNKATKPASRPYKQPRRHRQGGYLGLYIADVIKDGRHTLLVERVFRGSDAEKMGFRAGDEIVAVNGREVLNGDRFIMSVWSQSRMLRRGGAGRRPGGRRARKNEIVVLRQGKEVVIPGGLKELDAHPAVGDPAPRFTAKSQDGKTDVSLEKLLGKKPLVLIFGSYT